MHLERPLRHSKREWEGCQASVSRFVRGSGGGGQGLPSVTQNASGRGGGDVCLVFRARG
jgi:hypothetical protein